MLVREAGRVRLLWRYGTDWRKRYPWIVQAALKNRRKARRMMASWCELRATFLLHFRIHPEGN
jgi:hypothetical protein